MSDTRFEKPMDGKPEFKVVTEFYGACCPNDATEDEYCPVVLIAGRRGDEIRCVKQITWDAECKQMIIEI